jgi:hypothetical protein
MKCNVKSIFTKFVVIAFLLLSTSYLFGLRCNGRLINIGDWEEFVIRYCGEPTSKYQYVNKVFSNVGQLNLKPNETRVISENLMDRLVYNFGPNRLMSSLLFENGKLIKIENGDYGYTK